LRGRVREGGVFSSLDCERTPFPIVAGKPATIDLPLKGGGGASIVRAEQVEGA
jgi:hypothetical protein